MKFRGNGSSSPAVALVWRTGRVEAVFRPSERCQSAATLDELLANPELRTSRVVLALSGAETWCRTLTLPTAVTSELETMLELKLDTVVPLSAEEVTYGFLPLETRENETRLLLLVAPKSLVNERISALDAAKIAPQTVTVDALALFHWLLQRDRLHSDEKLHVLAHLTENTANFVFHSGGKPVGMRSLVCGGENSLTVLMEELRRSWLAMELQWESTARGRLAIVADRPSLRPLAAQFRDVWGGDAECLSEEVEAPLSALAACAQADGGLNLLPKEWKLKRRSERFRQRLIRTAVAVGLLYLIGVAVFAAALAIERMEQRRLAAEIASLQPRFTAARKLRDTLSAMQAQLDVKYSALEILREISRLMPDNLKLTDFLFLKNQTVTLRGMTSAPEQATEFISRLENSELFSKVKTVSMPTSGGLTRFDLICTLRSATSPVSTGTAR